MKAKTSFSLKDQLFNPEKVEYLGGLITQAFPEFDQPTFHTAVVEAFPNLELKERITHITQCLHSHLPKDYSQALTILLQALPPELDPHKTDDDFGDFIFAPLSLFVALYGCKKDYLDSSLAALKEITKRFSAEDAIRYFINTFPEETFNFLTACAHDENYHVRRLATEGTRPKLSWSQKLTSDYKKPLPLLNALYADPTRYVTRSVANHINDISKVDASLVIETLQRWQNSQQQTEREMLFIINHALRTLIKKGHPEALELLGFSTQPDISITQFATTTSQVKIGEAFQFSLKVCSHKSQRLVIDYRMIFASDNRKPPQKVFKIKQLDLSVDEEVLLTKNHPMRLMTTRRLQLGEHKIVLLINGQEMGSLTFDLITAD
ncbi:MAG: DNA alkylation repair protein [Cyanobacteria bacterium P01_D01_bin.156]